MFIQPFDQCEIWGLINPLHNSLGFRKMSSLRVSKLQHSFYLVRPTNLYNYMKILNPIHTQKKPQLSRTYIHR
jgi:hypothetical protein